MDERSPEQPYTVHQDVDSIGAVGTAAEAGEAPDAAPAHRSGPDPLALVAGLAALVIAALALTGSLAGVDPRWVLALGAIGVGCAVLLVTLRRRR